MFCVRRQLGPTLMGSTPVVVGYAIPGLLAAVFVHLHRLIVGSAVTDDARINRYLFWIGMGALVAVTVSFITVAAVPRSGAADGLVTGSVAAFVAALGMVAVNTFLIGNIFELSFWWSTIVTTETLWLAGYLLMLPVTLVMWPATWRNVWGWLLAVLTVVVGGMVTTGFFAVVLAAR